MTRTQRALARRWRGVLLVCALVALSGAVLVIWARIDHESERAEQLRAEADRRGTAVSTLATDVRRLRTQVKSTGRTPVAPDPTKAVDNLPDRAEVPVPIPGPRGPSGAPGRAGRDGEAGTEGSPGPSGQAGRNGTDGSDGQTGPQGPAGSQGDSGPAGPAGPQGETGERGPQGEQGERGEQGAPGPAGQSCPDGYSWQTPDYDPDAKVCRKDGAPDPQPTSPPPSTPAALAPDRRRP